MRPAHLLPAVPDPPVQTTAAPTQPASPTRSAPSDTPAPTDRPPLPTPAAGLCHRCGTPPLLWDSATAAHAPSSAPTVRPPALLHPGHPPRPGTPSSTASPCPQLRRGRRQRNQGQNPQEEPVRPSQLDLLRKITLRAHRPFSRSVTASYKDRQSHFHTPSSTLIGDGLVRWSEPGTPGEIPPLELRRLIRGVTEMTTQIAPSAAPPGVWGSQKSHPAAAVAISPGGAWWRCRLP
jgi:hypothetical protein